MAVLTFGDVKTQCATLLGISVATEPQAMVAIGAAVNTAHTKVVLAAIADGLDWAVRFACPITVPADSTYLLLPDGQTVADPNGNIWPKCMAVHSVMLNSTARLLTPQHKHVFELTMGRLESIGRSTPQFWDVRGYAGNSRCLWLMPYAGTADLVYIDYTCGLTFLTTDAQVLIPPEEHRELVCQESIANICSRDPFDPRVIARAEKNAEFLWRCMRSTARGAKPRFRSMPNIVGQTE